MYNSNHLKNSCFPYLANLAMFSIVNIKGYGLYQLMVFTWENDSMHVHFHKVSFLSHL
jgi:hypothetical protein